jgi:uncharacterized iron-regulated protein
MTVRALPIALLAVACATGGPLREPPDAPPEPSEPQPGRLAPTPRRAVPPRIDLDAAAVAYHGVRSSDGAAVEDFALLDDLARADAICVGEDVGDRHQRWLELQILHGLLVRADSSGREVALALPVFDTSLQEALAAYLAAAAPDEGALLEQAQWDARSLPDYGLYRPFLDTAREKHLTVLALGAPPKLAHKVASTGLESLDEHEKKQVPELVLDDPKHRALFEKGQSDRAYAAAVLSDETAADAAATYLRSRQPARQILIVTDARSCRAPAIPDRLRRRAHCQVVTVRPVLRDTGVDLQQVLAQYDYAVVLGSDND